MTAACTSLTERLIDDNKTSTARFSDGSALFMKLAQ